MLPSSLASLQGPSQHLGSGLRESTRGERCQRTDLKQQQEKVAMIVFARRRRGGRGSPVMMYSEAQILACLVRV